MYPDQFEVWLFHPGCRFMEDWDGKRWSSGVKLNWILGKSAGNPYIIAVPPHPPPKKTKKTHGFL